MNMDFNPGNQNPGIHNPIVTTIFDHVKHVINNEADKLIEEQTIQFRQNLIAKKNLVIAEIINCIEIQTMTNNIDNDINFNIRLKPSRFIK